MTLQEIDNILRKSLRPGEEAIRELSLLFDSIEKVASLRKEKIKSQQEEIERLRKELAKVRKTDVLGNFVPLK